MSLLIGWPGLLEVLVFGFAFATTLTAGYRVYRQRLTAYKVIRSFLVGVYALILAQMALDFYRIAFAGIGLMTTFFPVFVSLGVTQAVLLVAAAAGPYVNPMGDVRSFLADIIKRPAVAVLFTAFVGASVAVIALLRVFPEYSASTALDFALNVVPSVSIGVGYTRALVGLYAFFAAYPSVLLVASARKVSDRRLRKSLYMLSAGWLVVSALYLACEPFAWTRGVDFAGLMYAANSVVFFLVTGNFVRAAALAGFVRAARPGGPEAREGSRQAQSFEGNVLLIVDPVSPSEGSILKLANTLIDGGSSVFFFTGGGSRLKSVLTPRMRTFVITPRTSYVKTTENPAEVLLPDDTAMILDTLEKTYSTATEGRVAVFYDSLSDMVVSKGFDATYKFLKQAFEMGSRPNVTSFFLLLEGAHEERVTKIISAQFAKQLHCDERGLRVLK